MQKSATKGRGRPKLFDHRVLLALDDATMSAVDAWAERKEIGRSEALRRLVERGLAPAKAGRRTRRS